MKILIIYDSFFGNTEKIAQAVGNSLSSKENAETIRVSKVKPEQLIGLELIIVGSPTRAFRPTKAIMHFLNKIPLNGLKGVKVAAFDTRISTADVNSRFLNILVKLFGYAAKPIADKLEKKGGSLIIPPEGFFVKDSEGPLKDGEIERAVDWAKLIIKTL
ncbi:MAG TPA: flavodoxin family protein [Candidatus Atribacteria bacterium]|nr:flavodoxin family protein [Candidatus Atribacteria bacterium]